MFTSQAKTRHLLSLWIRRDNVSHRQNLDQFSAALSVPPGLRVQSLHAEGMRWPSVVSRHDQKHRTGMAARKLATATLNKICFKRVCVLVSLSLRTHTSALSHFWFPPEIQPRDNFYFPEFPHKVCTLTAHDDDLRVFIRARLNIYFSAGEAEKKNVSLRGSTSGGFNTISLPPLLRTADVYKTSNLWWHPRNHGIHIRARLKASEGVCVYILYVAPSRLGGISISHRNTLFWSSSSF